MGQHASAREGIDLAATDEDRSVDTRGAAGLLGLTPLGLADMRRRGGGPPFYRVGKRAVRYRLGDLRAWVAARTIGASR